MSNDDPKLVGIAEYDEGQDRPGEWVEMYQDDQVVRGTRKAILVELHPGDERWIPKSQCRISEGTIYVKRWFVDKELG